MALYIYKNNEQLGPYEDSVVADGLRNGKFLPNDMACPEGAKDWLPLSTLFPSETPVQSMLSSQQGVRHDVPKCLSCGAITPWKLDPILTSHHLIVGMLLLCAFGAGFFYLLTIVLIRLNPNMRAKICPQCGARNMWTFQY